MAESKPDYGNWVSWRLLYISGGASVVLLAAAWLLPLLLAPAAVCLVAFAYFLWARAQLAAHAGQIQSRFQDLVVEHLEWDGAGKALDIGCGNGPLAVRLAKRFPDAHVTGIDSWSGAWEYSHAACERNADAEGVAPRLSFRPASAAALPFEDGEFDAAVSNLVFHEVADAHDKRDVVREALRVVRKGGAFAFQDLFRMRSAYGDVDELLKQVTGWGVQQVAYADTSSADFVPAGLRLPFMVGTIGVLYGKK